MIGETHKYLVIKSVKLSGQTSRFIVGLANEFW